MKKVILLALLMPHMAFGQIVENFEAGAIVNWIQSTEGHWKADTAASLSGRFSLHHIFDNPDAGIDRIGIPLKNLHPTRGMTSWSFLVRHGYDPSSSNNWSVFVMSDCDPSGMPYDGVTNGYAIGVNLTGSDDTLRLWKVKGTLITNVINCRINWQTEIGINDAAGILVERSQSGDWTVTVRRLAGSIITTSAGSDSELFSPGWFGVCYKYTSTKDRLLWLDNISIEGIFYEDNTAPFIEGCRISGKNSLEITCSEEPLSGIMVPENFSLNDGASKSIYVEKKNMLTYKVEFAESFKNKTLNSLTINRLCDNSANCSQTLQIGFTPVWAETGDVVITEIMADPLPEISLPGREYLEIFNRTEYSFNLKNWKLSTEGQYTLFPETFIHPSDIVIICALQDTLIFRKFGNVIGVKQFPSLTSGGKLICITDSSGTTIHGVEYSSTWYKSELKSKGGWSLEMIDTRFPFYDEGNWTASLSKKGGSPGSINSVADNNPDVFFTGIQNVFTEDSTIVRVRFSEPVFALADKMNSFRIEGKAIIDLHPTEPLFREFSVKLSDALHTEEVFRLEISEDITDFAGNAIQKRNFNFGVTEPAINGDILFNELLVNSLPGDPEYLEMFNGSGKVIDASRLQLVSVNDDTGDISDPVMVSDVKRCILPGTYYAITTDSKRISERYPSTDPDHLFDIRSLPSMPDDKGHLILYSRELDRIDEVRYYEEMHYSLLSTKEGVALEKIGPQNKSDESANWHSASESSGWGTPGAQNSAFVEMPATSDNVVFSSSKITPDNDGNEDFLKILLRLMGNGNVVSVIVFDEAGNYVRKIAANLFAGSEASVIWDGTSDDGSIVKTGIYIILITIYDDTGKTVRWKKVCTVIRK